MATRELTPAPVRAEHAVAVLTAPLPPAAVKALAALSPHFPLVQAVAEYETAAEHAAQLAGLAESGRMTALDADSLAVAEDLMAAARATLAQAGRLDLIGVAA